MELQTNVKTGDVKINSPEVTATETKPIEKEPDLITRVSQVKSEVKPTETEIKEPEFDFKNIEAIKDPVAKEQALAAYKSFQKGYNQKFQELAEIRKTLEKKAADEGWTPEKVQGLLNDPNFVKAAQSVVVTSQPNEEEGMLTEKEKELMVQVKQHEAELAEIKKLNFQSFKAQQDAELKTKYANYNPQAMDTLTAELLSGKVQATREHLWRVYDYEEAVQRAYELGKKDGAGIKQEKIQSTSVEGSTAVSADKQVLPEKGENDRNLFRRIFLSNIEKSRTEQIRK